MEVYIVHAGAKEKLLAISSHNQVDVSFVLERSVIKPDDHLGFLL